MEKIYCRTKRGAEILIFYQKMTEIKCKSCIILASNIERLF